MRTARHGPSNISPITHVVNIHVDLAAQNVSIQEWSGTEPRNLVIQGLKEPKHVLLVIFLGIAEYSNGYVCANEKLG
jgi:mannonate dehydratase